MATSSGCSRPPLCEEEKFRLEVIEIAVWNGEQRRPCVDAPLVSLDRKANWPGVQLRPWTFLRHPPRLSPDPKLELHVAGLFELLGAQVRLNNHHTTTFNIRRVVALILPTFTLFSPSTTHSDDRFFPQPAFGPLQLHRFLDFPCSGHSTTSQWLHGTRSRPPAGHVLDLVTSMSQQSRVFAEYHRAQLDEYLSFGVVEVFRFWPHWPGHTRRNVRFFAVHLHISNFAKQLIAFPPHTVISMPALSPTMTAGNIGAWQKKAGDSLAPGDVLVEIETDKAQMDFEFQEEGTLAKILKDSGEKDVSVGSVRAQFKPVQDEC
jgi:hypothetical protein